MQLSGSLLATPDTDAGTCMDILKVPRAIYDWFVVQMSHWNNHIGIPLDHLTRVCFAELGSHF
jgi:hypothetical protein